MKVLYLDCFSGISGDMMVGALTDLGVQPSTFEWELSKVALGDFHMHFEKQSRKNVFGVKFGIHEGSTHRHEQDESSHDHEHGPDCEHHHHHEEESGHSHGVHSHEEHEHEGHSHEHPVGRNHAEIRELIVSSALSDFVKEKSLAIFQRIAVAEGKIHGVSPTNVTFHEVGALDSIADIICTCVGIEALGVDEVIVSKLFDGSDWIDCAHGRFPVPSTATLEILAGIPFSQIDEPFEFITPTGAAIVAEFGSGFTTMPELTVEKVGYGIGTRKLESRPNVLRAVLGSLDKKSSGVILQVETNLDDLSPEITGTLIDRLLQLGALDAFLTPVQMKKNRPGVLLTVLTTSPLLAEVEDFIYRETTSFGMRISELSRSILEREFREVRTEFGAVTIKMGLRNGKVLQRSPEFESCRKVAEAAGVSIREVFVAALAAASEPR